MSGSQSKPGDWQKHISKKHNVPYWFNVATNETTWTKPSCLLEATAAANIGVAGCEQGAIDDEPAAKRSRTIVSDNVATITGPKVAIIVPFRDIHVEQKRSEHLSRFVPEMSRFLAGHNFVIYIIEQSDDKKEFNRGKLLNVGYKIATSEGCEILVFHDVDLVPSEDLLPYYTTIPARNCPVHIARLWSRYNKNEKYFGGIVAFSKQQYESLNGYPNNFWGWGGEDDELMKRVQKVGFKLVSPAAGTIRDYEEMNLEQKLEFLKKHRDWKCPNKWELLNEHDATWRENGLVNLCFDIICDSSINGSLQSRRILVDISEERNAR